MESIPLYVYFILIALLFVLSAFFSGSETALMAVNRYRLANLSDKGHRGAQKVLKLLEKPDQLFALILLGNNFINILIAQIAAYVGYRIYGELGIAIATAILTFLLLSLAELTPKTFAAMHSQGVSLVAGFVYSLIGKPLYPMTRFASAITDVLLKILRVKKKIRAVDSLSQDDLRSALSASEKIIPYDYHGMLVGVLDLERKSVEDIMVPRNEIVGIDIEKTEQEIEDGLNNLHYTRVPIFRGTIDNIVGVLHARNVLHAIQSSPDSVLDVKKIDEYAKKPYFLSEYTRLIDALHQFKDYKRRMGLVVDEYGTIQGLVTMEDLLEEIVGDFTNDPGTYDLEITKQADGSILVDGGCHVCEINQLLQWKLDESGPKTINGLLLGALETIPEHPVCTTISGHHFEVVKVQNHAIKLVKIKPPKVDQT